jgi:hypothetical protein
VYIPIYKKVAVDPADNRTLYYWYWEGAEAAKAATVVAADGWEEVTGGWGGVPPAPAGRPHGAALRRPSGGKLLDLTVGAVVEAVVDLGTADGSGGVLVAHACTPYTGAGRPPAAAARASGSGRGGPPAAGRPHRAVGDPIRQAWCTPEAAGSAMFIAVNDGAPQAGRSGGF